MKIRSFLFFLLMLILGCASTTINRSHNSESTGQKARGEPTMNRSPQEQANLDFVLEMFAKVLNPMDSTQVDRFIASDYIQHNQSAPPGRDALKAFLDMIRAETPQAVHDIKRAFVDGDYVTVHYHVRRFPGDAGWAVIDIFRLENGMIKEHWDVMQDVKSGGPNPNSPF
jgi:predicted SnoaL-like aldol condensation-catalyzing enzyme